MSSVKCPRCGFVNFSFQTECKRCKVFLNAAPAPSFQQFDAQNFQPPMPSQGFYLPQICVKCGTSHNLSLQKFKKTYTPPLAYLGVLIGILPFLIMLMIFKKDHYISAAFCGDCWGRFRFATAASVMFGLGCLFTLFVTVVAGLALQSGLVAFAGIALGIAIAAWGGYYDKQISPKYKKVNRKMVVIEVPNVGEIDFAPVGVLIQSR